MTVDLLLANDIWEYFGLDKKTIPHIKDVHSPDHWSGLWRIAFVDPADDDSYSPLNEIAVSLFTNETTRFSHLMCLQTSDLEELLEDFVRMLSNPLKYQTETTESLPEIKVRLLRGPHPSLAKFMAGHEQAVNRFLDDGISHFDKMQNKLNKEPVKKLGMLTPLQMIKKRLESDPPTFLTTDPQENILTFPNQDTTL